MSQRTPNDDKAIAWYCKENNLIPQLSTHPTYNFVHRETREESSVSLMNIRARYEAHMKESRKEAARERKRARDAERSSK